MKKLISLLFLCIAGFTTLSAQKIDPVTWTSEIEKISDTEYNLIYKATIDDKWRLYSQYLEENSGFPTEFMYDSIQKANDFALVGKSQESKGITKFDKVFQAELTYFKNTATFTQKIKITNPEATQITSEVIYQTCDDEKCVLGDEVFTFQIPGTNGVFDSQEESNIFDPVEWSGIVDKISDNEYELIMTAKIAENWHLYSQRSYGDLGPFPTEFAFLDEGKGYTTIGRVKESPTKDVYDKIFQMNISYYEGKAIFKQKIKVNDSDMQSVTAEVIYMVCDDEKCLPPTAKEIVIPLDNSVIIKAQNTELTVKDIMLSKELDLNITGSEEFESTEELTEKSNISVFILGFLGGLIALLTPCVFPMIPLTVSFFTKSGSNTQKGLANSILYGFFIFLTYFLLSLPFHLLDSLDPEILNNISTNATLNVIFFLVFVVFAFSFFGYFELTLPSSWSNSLDSKANSVGGAIGIFLMALVLVIVSFSCTGPILGALLGSTTLAAGDPAMKLTMGMSGFGLALALPFTLFAMFPKWLNSLPRSGGWLNSVKVVLGFIELALAMKFLSNADLVSHWGILKREIFIGIWILLGIGLALYLFGKLKFPHDSPIKKLSFSRISLGILVIAFVIYLIPGLTNTKYANLKLLSGFPPPLFYSLHDQEFEGEHSDCPLNLPCYKNLEEGLAAAEAQNKPVMLDFTGWACVNCRKMEEQVWSQSKVFDILNEDYILISLYVDDRKSLPEDEKFKFDKGNGNIKKIRTYGDKMATLQTLNFNNNSQPYYVLLSSDMKKLQKPIGYTPNAEEYANWLKSGLEKFKQQNQK